MNHRLKFFFVLALLFAALTATTSASDKALPDGRYLYVAEPGIRNYLEYGGHGLLVYDIDTNYRFLKRIPTGGLDDKGKPINVKGVCASAKTGRIYLSTIRTMMCLDLVTEKLLWERAYEGGCDRMAITPDGKEIYLPSFEKDHWHVVDAANGDVLRRIDIQAGAHNTICGLDGREAYLAGLKSPNLRVVDTKQRAIVREIGPFTHSIRPFTVNAAQTLCFVNVNELLGFEVGDLKTGKKLHRVEVQGFSKGPVKRHGCPSHGIGLTPDEKELWVCDATNQRMHVFDATVMPPKQAASIPVRDEPGWITFRLDGRHAWPSTGDIIDVRTRQVVAQLTDEEERQVMSEKIVEIHWQGGKPVRNGDQFGLGRAGR
jgi:DNA-binding beta-propeller fold protein YncE